MRRFIVTLVAAGACWAVTGCGAEGDGEQISAAVRKTQAAFAERDMAGVCAHLTDGARRHVQALGHETPGEGSCAARLEIIATGIRREAGKTGAREPVILRVVPDGDRAVVVLKGPTGARSRIPMRRVEGEWKLDALYGEISGSQQEDRFP